MRRTARSIAAGVLMAACLGALAVGAGESGHAAGMTVATGRISTFRPGQMPVLCTTQTVIADADAWVNGVPASQGTNYGTAAALQVTGARPNMSARTLIRMPLPAAGSCTLASATLRVFNVAPTAGRSLSVLRAASGWTESLVTFTSMPATAGTAVTVTAPAAAGWMEWSVTAHVQALYSTTNTGFILRDAAESGTTAFTQSFHSRDAANKPELVLTWQ